MAVWNTVNISYVLDKNRIDSEFYKKEDVSLENFLLKACKKNRLRNVVQEIPERFTKNNYQSFQYNDIGNTDVLNGTICENIIEGTKAPGRATYINVADDILISTVRPNRNANAIVNPSNFLQVGSNGFCNIRTKSINANYIFIYSKTRYFIDVLIRATTSSMYPSVSNKNILDVPFYIATNSDIDSISKKVCEARALLLESQLLYKKASNFLVNELDLDRIKFQNTKNFVAQYSVVATTRRLDTTHYQPKFEELLTHLTTNFDCKKIGYLVSKNRRGLQPNYVSKGDISVINSKHITSTHLKYEDFEKTTVDNYNSSVNAQIIKGDILIYTTGAYVGATNVYLLEEKALASNHVNILRLKESEIDSTYLALVLNTTVGKMQTEKHIRGSAQAELYPSDIAKFIVPILSKDKMNEIGSLVRESLKCNQESKRLLEEAKNRVELLIEEAANK